MSHDSADAIARGYRYYGYYPRNDFESLPLPEDPPAAPKAIIEQAESEYQKNNRELAGLTIAEEILSRTIQPLRNDL
jgi:hypothetical protein